ncbi:MAG TPA: peptidoglycan DD-metalloendopeptidase family protein [Thermohalobaculum sp.]|nr:peptidoglycan DD-metalloendopeptidase family protein [Thermohalobaculum sp.]
MGNRNSGGFMRVAAALALLAAAGCTSKQSADNAAVEIRGTEPSGSAAAASVPQVAAAPTVSADGIVSYEGYQAAVARSGDTVGSVAERIGLSATELGAYNGLQASHPLRAGDELVLPPRPGGYGVAPAPQPYQPSAAPQPANGVTAIELTPLSGGAASGLPAAEPAAPAASDGTWSPDLAAAAIDRAAVGTQGNLAPPPSAAEPLPPDPQLPGTLTSPQLNQYQTPAPAPRPVEVIPSDADQIPEPETVAQGTQVEAIVPAAEPQPVPQAAQPETVPQAVAVAPAPAPKAAAKDTKLRLIRPVQGPIVIGFRQGGRTGNDGVDFASPASSPVLAAADGEVALVSKSLGGLGTIVLVRHPGDYLTVYGRIERVDLTKGDLVRQGQQIGVVAATSRPRMHFEVRRGAESLDPELFF